MVFRFNNRIHGQKLVETKTNPKKVYSTILVEMPLPTPAFSKKGPKVAVQKTSTCRKSVAKSSRPKVRWSPIKSPDTHNKVRFFKVIF